MNKKQQANMIVKESITIALLNLMEKQDIDSINIYDITNKAGVARVSFYRNFESKQDVLKKYLDQLIEEWRKYYESLNDESLFSDSMLRHFYKHKDFYLLLYKQNLSEMIYENIRESLKLEESKNNIEKYVKSMIAGMIFGWLDEWMRQGMPEDPDEINLLMEGLKGK